ncbi:MAG: tetratricopeptide repeat protein [Muribaculaceae bacterium]|nr:tetratricopeptide repeat protein [Muribaculaceae bacterium]
MAENNNSQDLNSIDDLNNRLTNAGQKVADNKKIIYWALGIIVVIAVFIGSYFWIYRNPGLNNSWAAYNQVELTANGNDTIRAREYAKVADKYSHFDAGNVASLAAAEAYYNIGKYQEAVKYLDKFDTSDDVLLAQAKMLLGDSYVNLKKYDEAISAFKYAEKKSDKNPQIAPRVLLKMAVVYDEQKKYGDALKCYETIKKDYPQFSLGNGLSIDSYIEREKARL